MASASAPLTLVEFIDDERVDISLNRATPAELRSIVREQRDTIGHLAAGSVFAKQRAAAQVLSSRLLQELTVDDGTGTLLDQLMALARGEPEAAYCVNEECERHAMAAVCLECGEPIQQRGKPNIQLLRELLKLMVPPAISPREQLKEEFLLAVGQVMRDAFDAVNDCGTRGERQARKVRFDELVAEGLRATVA